MGFGERGSLLKKWYFVTKIVLTYCEKKYSSDREKLLKFEAEGPRICKIFEITRTIYSNSERSEQFLVTECFLTCSWRFLRSNKIRTIRIQIGKNYWDLETSRKI